MRARPLNSLRRRRTRNSRARARLNGPGRLGRGAPRTQEDPRQLRTVRGAPRARECDRERELEKVGAGSV